MSERSNRREWPVWMVWAILVGASLLGFLMAEGLAPPGAVASIAVILAAVKIHLVFDHYMDLRWSHRPLRQLLAAWLTVVVAILLITHWLS